MKEKKIKILSTNNNKVVELDEYEFWETLGLSMGKTGLGEHMKKAHLESKEKQGNTEQNDMIENDGTDL